MAPYSSLRSCPPPTPHPCCKVCPYFLLGKTHFLTKSSQAPLLQITVTSFPLRALKSKTPGITSPQLRDPGKVIPFL